MYYTAVTTRALHISHYIHVCYTAVTTGVLHCSHCTCITHYLGFHFKDDMKTLESNYEGSCEELELLEEDMKNNEAKRVKLTDELDELKEEFMKSKVRS